MRLVFIFLHLATALALMEPVQAHAESRAQKSCLLLLMGPSSAPSGSLRDQIEKSGLRLGFSTGNVDKVVTVSLANQKYNNKKPLPLNFEERDLLEPDVDIPYFVAAQKAMKVRKEGHLVFIEDGSLEVYPHDGEERPELGVNIKWRTNRLKNWGGHEATWTSCLAFYFNGLIYVYVGQVDGTIRTDGRGDHKDFTNYFVPKGRNRTYLEIPKDELTISDTPVMQAFARFLAGEPPAYVIGPMDEWQGPWQHAE